MAKRKKKLAGLGGSSRHHYNELMEDVKVAKKAANFAEGKASQGDCHFAFSELMTANSYLYVASVNANEAFGVDLDSRPTEVTKKLADAKSAVSLANLKFASKCLVKK